MKTKVAPREGPGGQEHARERQELARDLATLIRRKLRPRPRGQSGLGQAVADPPTALKRE